MPTRILLQNGRKWLMCCSILLGGLGLSSAWGADAPSLELQAGLEKEDATGAPRVEPSDQPPLFKSGKNFGLFNPDNLREICDNATGGACEAQKQQRVTLHQALAEHASSTFSVASLRLPVSYHQAIDAKMADPIRGKSENDKRKEFRFCRCANSNSNRDFTPYP